MVNILNLGNQPINKPTRQLLNDQTIMETTYDAGTRSEDEVIKVPTIEKEKVPTIEKETARISVPAIKEGESSRL